MARKKSGAKTGTQSDQPKMGKGSVPKKPSKDNVRIGIKTDYYTCPYKGS